jgi:hypothetical protein
VVGYDEPCGFLTKFLFLMSVITAGIEAGAYLTLDTTYNNYILLYVYIYIYMYMDTRVLCFVDRAPWFNLANKSN